MQENASTEPITYSSYGSRLYFMLLAQFKRRDTVLVSEIAISKTCHIDL